MSREFHSNNNVVYSCIYHVIWCPKYRRKVLVGQVETRLKQIISEVTQKCLCKIQEMEVMPDHVHLFVKCSTTDSPHWIIGQLKGLTSHELRREFRQLRTRVPTLWSRSYYCESVGHISERTVRKYIESQKN